MTSPTNDSVALAGGKQGRLNVTFALWNRWVPVRFERTADGTATWYFGIGKVGWRRGAV